MAIYGQFHSQLKKFAPMRLHCHYKHTADLGLSITKRYKENEMRQRKNQKANEKAIEVFRQEVGKKYPSHDEKIRYRLWRDQDQRCAYSGNVIALGQIFSADCEIDHILPFKKSLCQTRNVTGVSKLGKNKIAFF
jgi:CRISPR-associated endonuclease Csn1